MRVAQRSKPKFENVLMKVETPFRPASPGCGDLLHSAMQQKVLLSEGITDFTATSFSTAEC
jgi:hypothetical protein